MGEEEYKLKRALSGSPLCSQDKASDKELELSKVNINRGYILKLSDR